MGNRSIGSAPPGVPCKRVRVPGFFVSASICIPRSHPHALWVLPWVEEILRGRRLSELMQSPPWPFPSSELLAQALCRTLLELRWAVPDWTTGEVAVDRALADAFADRGRLGLAERLFDAEVIEGQWWAEGLEGTILARQAFVQFDWDGRMGADVVVPSRASPSSLVDAARPSLRDLLRKLGRIESLQGKFDRAFLASPLTAGERKEILFEVFGDERRLVPSELIELVPALERHCPSLLKNREERNARFVELPSSPIEAIDRILGMLDAPEVRHGPVELRARLASQLDAEVRRRASELEDWLKTGTNCHLVAGPTHRHFAALREICTGLSGTSDPHLIISSAFLSPSSLRVEGGLPSALAAAPEGTRFTILYGHASDDLPERQSRDIDEWLRLLHALAPDLKSRVDLIAGERRSHEKVVLSSTGEWMVGSWNACSSRPDRRTFECSLRGRGSGIAGQLLERLATNLPPSRRAEILRAVRFPDELVAPPTGQQAKESVHALARVASATSQIALASESADGESSRALCDALRAMYHAMRPFRRSVHLQVVDEHQTRDVLVALLQSAQREVLAATDRLSEGALDVPTTRALWERRVALRLVWGREGAEERGSDEFARSQLGRARDTVRCAREMLGALFSSSENPMENHAKFMIVDGMRGLVTSENVFAYGGEKSRYESRELGLAFSSPSIGRDLVGRALREWAVDLGSVHQPLDRACAWAVAGNEAWHGLSPLASDLQFEWRDPSYLAKVVSHGEEATVRKPDEQAQRAQAWRDLAAHAEGPPFAWVLREAERVGLAFEDASGRWLPYDSDVEIPIAIERVEAAASGLAAQTMTAAGTDVRVDAPQAEMAVHPLVEEVQRGLVLVPAGSFLMGDDRVADEAPRHQVRISRPFWLGRTPVTQSLWKKVMRSHPHLRDRESHPDFPVIYVTRDGMLEFLDRLNRLPGGGGFTLPTEAQWEHACRAGAQTVYCFGDDAGTGDRPGRLEQYAWTKRNSNASLQKVGMLKPNAFGLHDMHGLVYETMLDGFRRYTARAELDPVGPMNEGRFVARGGSWGRSPVNPRNPAAEHFRCASRQHYEQSPRVSFRIARVIAGSQ